MKLSEHGRNPASRVMGSARMPAEASRRKKAHRPSQPICWQRAAQTIFTRTRAGRISLFLWNLLILWWFCAQAQVASAIDEGDELVIARLQYGGGGDWYNDRSIIPNLMHQVKERIDLRVAKEEFIVTLSDPELFQHPFLFLTGHGNIKFSQEEIQRLRLYLTQGGFLYADDDYGMDAAFRREMKRVFPDQDLVELPYSHPIYHTFYEFPSGLPKIHEHDGQPPQGFGLFHEGRLILFYTYETNISDGWADPEVHQDPPEIREQAFQMGVNIVLYALLY